MVNEQNNSLIGSNIKISECSSCGAPLNGSSICQWCGTSIPSNIRRETTSTNQVFFQYEHKGAADLFEDSIDEFEEKLTKKLKKLIGY